VAPPINASFPGEDPMKALPVRRKHLPLASSIVATLAAMPGAPALAADIRVDVTGTNIKRVEGEGALPVQTITRSEIDRSGATSTAELLQLISANNSLGATALVNSVGALTFSAQTASLRGLGGGRTLVLINGHRVDGFAGEIQNVQGVNLAAVPFSAIERVEVLKDGASAIYGSDAIAGVINFILRSDYVGAEATGYYGTPTRSGGGDQWQGSASVGFGDLAKDRYNVFLSASYNEQKSLDQRDRNFSRTSYLPNIGLIGVSSNTFPGNVTTGGIGVVGAPNNCAPSTFFEDLGGCYYDPSRQPGVNMLPQDKLWNFFGTATFQISNDWQAYATALYSHDETQLTIQPGPVSSLFPYGPLNDIPSTITLQATSPFYPHALAAAAGVDGQPLDVRWRAVELGGRSTTDTNENAMLITGAKGSWRDWDFDASVFYSEGKTKQHIDAGYQVIPPLLDLLNSGTVNLFGPNTPEIHRQLEATSFVGDAFNGTSKNYGLQGKASGEIWKLPAGPLALAVGGEVRKETLDQIPGDLLQLGDVTGFGGAIGPVEGSRRAWATFAELNIPIIRTLEANAAVRYDHYSDFGGTTNPKFSLRWQPTRSLLVRGSWGTGFLAPSLYQLISPAIGNVTPTGFSDPVRCPVTGDTGLDCDTQFGDILGGNPNLKPEESEQTTLGIVFEPTTGVSFSVDWFKINLKNAITTGIPIATILGNLDLYGSLVTRGAPDPNFPDLPGRIATIDQRYINLGAVHVQGVDIEAHARSPVMDWGRLSFNLNGTYYLRYDNQNTDGTWTGTVGTAFGSVNTGIIPRWKHYASLTWDKGPWSATLAQTFQDSYTDWSPDLDGNLRTVGTMSLWDLQGSYTGFKNLKLTLGVKNLFDRDPPISNQQNTFILGFDPSYYDPRARFVYASVTYKFY
jgi:iron complex outermembrane recepter protein